MIKGGVQLDPLIYNIILIAAISVFCLSTLYIFVSFIAYLEQKSLIKMEVIIRNIIDDREFFEKVEDDETSKKYVLKKYPVKVDLFVTNKMIYCEIEFYRLNGLSKKQIMNFSYDRSKEEFVEYLEQNGYLETKPNYSAYKNLLKAFGDKIVKIKWRLN